MEQLGDKHLILTVDACSHGLVHTLNSNLLDEKKTKETEKNLAGHHNKSLMAIQMVWLIWGGSQRMHRVKAEGSSSKLILASLYTTANVYLS